MSALAPYPNRNQQPDDFIATANAWAASLPLFQDELIALLATATTVVSGSASSMVYTLDTTITDSDPGAGKFRFSSSTQNAATVIRLDLTGNNSVLYTALIDSFAASTSGTKGQLSFAKVGDPTKFLHFDLTAIASPSGYKNLTVVNTGSSATSPFVNGDVIQITFTRTGDMGSAGTIVRRVTSTTSSSTPTPNAATTDIVRLTALATAPTFGVPTGSPVDGQGLMIRVKNNGTARLLVFNVIYRNSTNMVLPSTTIVNKTMYLGFVYNAADTKWDLIAILDNF